MKKIIGGLICIIVITVNVQAQTTIVGKWKLVQFVSPESGVVPIDSIKLKEVLYKERVDAKKDTALVAADTLEVEGLSMQLYNQFSSTLIEYRANKTYVGTFGGTTTTGTYIYNAAKKTITTKPKGKTPKSAVVSFENSMLVFNDKKENIMMYFIKVK
jgi:hypothetical protein